MLKGVLLVVTAATCWGLGGVSGQYMFTYHGAEAVWVVMVRQVLTGLLFLAYSQFVQRENIFSVLKNCTMDILQFSFFGVLAAQLGFYYVIGLCNAATSTVLQYMAPIYVMLWMSFKERKMPEGREIFGIFAAIFGVFMIATHGSLDSLAISPIALFVGELSAIGYAYYSVKPVEMLKKYKSSTIVGWGQFISGASLVLLRDPFHPVGNWDIYAALAMAYLILGATVASSALYFWGVKIVGPTKASLISCAEPLASIIAVVLLLGTHLTLADYIGMACIIFTVALLSLPKK